MTNLNNDYIEIDNLLADLLYEASRGIRCKLRLFHNKIKVPHSHLKAMIQHVRK